jgi:hypothetical protein
MQPRLKTLLAAAVLAVAPLAHADAPAPGAVCEMLKLADFAQVVDAPTRVAESTYLEATATDPAACLIRGYVAPQVGFEMKVPATGWNGKLVELGSGGFAGSTQGGIEKLWCDELVRSGHACIHSDHGHTSGVGEKSIAALDGVWAFDNPQAEIDYAYRALHVTALAGKAIVRRYYGAQEQRAYFLGCSGGGRQALVAAQRFPWDFDGIVAMEPAINLSGAFMSFLYNYRAVTDSQGAPLFKVEELQMLHDAAIAQCDRDDGLEDGIIGHPLACAFDPGKLACTAGHAEKCLSPVQVAAAKKMYAGAMTSSGKRLHPGHVMPGAEVGSFGFNVTRPLARLALNDFFRYLAFVPDAGPEWNPASFDFDQDYKRLALMEQLYAASNPDLRAFRDAGGKLIIAQGWDDSGAPFPLGTIDYYETVEKTMGGRKATQDFARLFMVPGRQHCGGGEGASAADFFAPLRDWVESGKAPEVIQAMHVEPLDMVRAPADNTKIRFTRPLYPYPQRAKYQGKGDKNDWRSFKPVEP